MLLFPHLPNRCHRDLRMGRPRASTVNYSYAYLSLPKLSQIYCDFTRQLQKRHFRRSIFMLAEFIIFSFMKVAMHLHANSVFLWCLTFRRQKGNVLPQACHFPEKPYGTRLQNTPLLLKDPSSWSKIKVNHFVSLLPLMLQWCIRAHQN